MKDKETKEWKKRLTSSYSYSMGESEYFMVDGKETNIDDLQDFISEIEQEAERRGRVEENKRCVKLIGEAIQATSWEAPQQFFDGLRCARSSIET